MKRIDPAQSGAELRKRLMAEYPLDGAAAQVLLDACCSAFDEALAAEETVKRDGLVVQGARGAKAHPCLAVARNARLRMLQVLKQMRLEI